jgi:alpha-glucosidase
VNGPEQEAIRRHYIEERYKLMPYLYTTAEEMSRTGCPSSELSSSSFPMRRRICIPLIWTRRASFSSAQTFWSRPRRTRMRWTNMRCNCLRVSGTTIGQASESIARRRGEPRCGAEKGAQAAGCRDSAAYRGAKRRHLACICKRRLDSPHCAPDAKHNGNAGRPFDSARIRGDNCVGTLYQDDGVSYDFMQGAFLRMDSTCSVEHDTLHVHLGPHQGKLQGVVVGDHSRGIWMAGWAGQGSDCDWGLRGRHQPSSERQTRRESDYRSGRCLPYGGSV